jgi:hypothetical protein
MDIWIFGLLGKAIVRQRNCLNNSVYREHFERLKALTIVAEGSALGSTSTNVSRPERAGQIGWRIKEFGLPLQGETNLRGHTVGVAHG